MISIVRANAVEWANNYSGELFHSLLCDPPYHLTSIVKRFGKTSMSDDTQTSDRARRGVDGFARLARSGFMGATWDGGDVAFQPDTWAAFMKVLHPGAFGMAFASSRGWHRLASAIEDAGYIIFPSIFGWVNGQSFPKATNIHSGRIKDAFLLSSQGGIHSIDKVQDFQGSYPERCHSCGGQLRWLEVAFQDGLPSQDDAQKHTHFYDPSVDIQVDNEQKHIQAERVWFRPSKKDYSRQSLNLRPVGVSRESIDSSQHQSSSLDIQDSSTSLERDENKNISASKKDFSLEHGQNGVQTLPHILDKLPQPASSLSPETSTCNFENKNDSLQEKQSDLDETVYGKYRTQQDGKELHCIPNLTLELTSSDPPLNLIYTHYTLGCITCQGHEFELAKQFRGHRYGGQVLKNSLEPIIVFQKPYEGKPIDCMVVTGAGALNIDGGRIPSDKPYTINTWDDDAHPFGNGAGNPFTSREETGRWPANFILGDEEAARALDSQSGHLKSGHMGPEHQREVTAGEYQSPHGIYGKFNNEGVPLSQTIGDEGGASRFFFRVQEQIDESDPVYYCSKASKSERKDGLDSYITVKYNLGGKDDEIWKFEEMEVLLKRAISEWQIENLSIAVCGEAISVRCRKDSLSTIKMEINKITELKILNWLMQLLTNECTVDANCETAFGGSPVNLVENSNQLIKKIGIFLKKDGLNMENVANAIFEKLSRIKDENGWSEWRSDHPTHKPIALAKYLATLLLPPDMYAPRRIFIPFAGVASECIGAHQALWEEIVGVEMEEQYCQIARARAEYWEKKGVQLEMFK